MISHLLITYVLSIFVSIGYLEVFATFFSIVLYVLKPCILNNC